MRWNIEPILFEIGPLEIRWYGLFFATGLLIGVSVLQRSFTDRGIPKKHANSLSLWMPVGMLLGAHLIHLIFYEPRSFIDNPVRIIELGSGLASHGGGLGAVTALWLFARKKKRSAHEYADAGVIGAVWVIPFVRIGNFFNSEIVGRPTDVQWAVIFERYGDQLPRHPSQLYEATVGFLLCGLAWFAHKKRASLRPGVTVYLLLGFYFLTRFGLEYFKEYQTLSPDLPFTMGQLLSTPIVLLCAFMAVYKHRQPVVQVEAAASVAAEPKKKKPSSSSVVKTRKRKRRKR